MNEDTLGDTFISYASEVLADTSRGLTAGGIVKHCVNYGVRYNVEIPIASSNFGRFGSLVKNKRIALSKNLAVFNAKQQFKIIKDLTELDLFKDNDDAKELKQTLLSRYGNLADMPLIESELVVKTKHFLEEYPRALSSYNAALAKYHTGAFERNLLDDLRLSFELLVKTILGNDKSLENQLPELGRWLKEKVASKELTNMIKPIIKYYTDFQNNHVKHDVRVNCNEIEYVVELTSSIMKFLIKMSKGTK